MHLLKAILRLMKQLKTYDIQANNILSNNPSIIQSLIKMQFISRDLIGQILGCPNCKSINIFAQYLYHNCNKGNFKKKEIRIHSNCGKIIDTKRF